MVEGTHGWSGHYSPRNGSHICALKKSSLSLVWIPCPDLTELNQTRSISSWHSSPGLEPRIDRKITKHLHKPNLYCIGTSFQAGSAPAFSLIYKEEACSCESNSDFKTPNLVAGSGFLVSLNRPARLQVEGGCFCPQCPPPPKKFKVTIWGVFKITLQNDRSIYLKPILYQTTLSMGLFITFINGKSCESGHSMIEATITILAKINILQII